MGSRHLTHALSLATSLLLVNLEEASSTGTGGWDPSAGYYNDACGVDVPGLLVYASSLQLPNEIWVFRPQPIGIGGTTGIRPGAALTHRRHCGTRSRPRRGLRLFHMGV